MSAALNAADAFATWSDGLHRDMPEAQYHQRVLGVVSKSALIEFARTPLHYKAWVDGLVKDEETDALAFGKAFHCAVLEPERFERSYVVAPYFGDRRYAGPKAAHKEWASKNEGKTILDADDGASIEGMQRALRAHPLASKMMKEGEAELTALWTDDETGLRCKARTDFAVRSHRMLVDVKSTEDASPDAFRRSIFKWKYHWQHAHYRAGFAACGETYEHFIFIAVEKKPPHAIGVYTLDSLGVALAHERVRLHMRRMAECVLANDWPGYDAGIQTIETPAWET